MKMKYGIAGFFLLAMIFTICNPDNYPCTRPMSMPPSLPGAKGICPPCPPDGYLMPKGDHGRACVISL